MYKCIKSLITGYLNLTVFSQIRNLPTHKDGVALFKELPLFTTVASLQLSTLSFYQILSFDSAEYYSKIPVINKIISNLFFLAATQTHQINDAEKIQYILTVYDVIKQPEQWTQWIRNKSHLFEEGPITNCQDFINLALLKYNKIIRSSIRFNRSSKTVQDNIGAMISTIKKKKILPPPRGPPAGNFENDNNVHKQKVSPFFHHFKSSADEGGTLYKLGDKKDWKGSTYHYCDFSNNRGKIKQHTHPLTECRSRKYCLDNKGGEPTANVAVVEEDG